ncbi:MAG TPA: ATP-binding cassette domain-containing protein [Acidimicrobiales bacterium]|nr:ATP-binding cassette domain-containing protein [Acidimicrobiales bacterium]
MGAIEVTHLSYTRPGGRQILEDVGFHVGDGQHVALVGPNGAGKSTLLRLLVGDEEGQADGGLRIDGRYSVMPQMIGMMGDGTTVRDLLLALATPLVQAAAARLRAAEAKPDDGVALANAYAAWSDAGGYDVEVFWDACATRATGVGLDELGDRPVTTLSGGEQKKLALQVLLQDEGDVLLLDEPDNFLDIPGKRWLERELNKSNKTVLYVSHDRELLAATAHKIVTIEGGRSWTHGGSFTTYHEARRAHVDRLDADFERWKNERDRLFALMKEMKRRAAISDANAARAKAAETRLRRFEDAGPPPEPPRDQALRMQLAGGRTGKRAVRCERLELVGLTDPFDSEIFYGERIAVVGPNGTGKSHFLKLLAGEDVLHEGEARLGARVVPGHFSQTHDHPELASLTVREIVEKHGLQRGPAMAALKRYEVQGCAEQPFSTLSGGQQARVQVLLLELGGATLLLLDEPTDNLDLASAEALQDALEAFDGTVIAVTHDRWFMRSFDRFLVFEDSGTVNEAATAPVS